MLKLWNGSEEVGKSRGFLCDGFSYTSSTRRLISSEDLDFVLVGSIKVISNSCVIYLKVMIFLFKNFYQVIRYQNCDASIILSVFFNPEFSFCCFLIAGILILVSKICFCCSFLNSVMGLFPWKSTCIALVHLLLYPEPVFLQVYYIEYSLHVDSSSKQFRPINVPILKAQSLTTVKQFSNIWRFLEIVHLHVDCADQ